MKESQVEAYFADVVRAHGGEVRKVKWIGRRGAPDRRAMMPPAWGKSFWVEFKNPKTIETFPANGHERQQAREHSRMRKLGELVLVIGTIEQVDELFA